MAGIVANPEWKSVRVLERDEVALGGVDGNMNEQATSLVARTELLKQDLETKANQSDVDATFSAYVGGRKAYTTLALAQADQANLPINTAVEVTNDPTSGNNGTYQWDGTTLTKSDYDPLTQAKEHTDSTLADGYIKNYPNEALLLADKPTVLEMRGRVDDTRKIYRWNRTSAEGVTPIIGAWTVTGLSDLDQANVRAKKAESTLYKAFRYAPFMGFSDVDIDLVVDKNGVILYGDRAIRDIKKQASFQLSPYLSFNDTEDAQEVDKNGVILTSPVTQKSTPVLDSIYVELSFSSKSLKISWQHDTDKYLQTEWKPNGANDLFNFYALRYAVADTPIDKAEWQSIAVESSDYLPPMQCIAVNNGDGNSWGSSTGGNHLGLANEKTAHMTQCDFYIDGVIATEDIVCFASKVSVKLNHELTAWNTYSIPRYVLDQSFVLNFYQHNVEVLSEVTAKEQIKIRREGGVQLIGTNYTEYAHFYEGTAQSPQTSGVTNSGTKTEAPNVWALVLKGTHGYAATWMDRDYGVKTDHVDSDKPLAYKNGATWKFYHSTIETSDVNALTLNVGESYRWHGGYSWYPANVTNLLDGFAFNSFNKKALGLSQNTTTGTLKLLPNLITKFDAVETTTKGVVSTNTGSYQTTKAMEI